MLDSGGESRQLVMQKPFHRLNDVLVVSGAFNLEFQLCASANASLVFLVCVRYRIEIAEVSRRELDRSARSCRLREVSRSFHANGSSFPRILIYAG